MPPDLVDLPLPAIVVLLIVAAGVIVAVGPRMVRVADRLADVTGLGEALIGAVLVGMATSLADGVATITPALAGLPDLAVGNALGGVLGQTAFLAVADLAYPRANLEHAAASLPNLVQGSLLVTLLAIVLVAMQTPQVAVLGVHPATLLLPIVYGYGLRLAGQAEAAPMWQPTQTSETREDVPQEKEQDHTPSGLLARFAVYGVLLAGAGYILGRSGEALVVTAGLTESLVGVFVTGVASSLAELVVSISAVRAGALTLAVGNVIGGNTFDTLLVGVADVAYRDGSVYASISGEQTAIVGISIFMTAVLLLGLLRRERHGIGNIGLESTVVLVAYAGALVLLMT